MSANGGLVTREDLAAYRPVVRRPVRGSYRGHDIHAMYPPSSGGTAVVEILNILEGYDLARSGHNAAATIHLVAEAMKRAFADVSVWPGDPDAVEVPVRGLTSKAYATALRRSGSEAVVISSSVDLSADVLERDLPNLAASIPVPVCVGGLSSHPALFRLSR